jgi:hypothetical protein
VGGQGATAPDRDLVGRAHAVGHALRYLEKFGFEVVELPVDRYGGSTGPARRRDHDRRSSSRSCSPTTRSGTIQPIAEIAERVRSPRACCPRRRVQAAPYVDLGCESSARTRLDRRAQVRRAQGRRRAVRPHGTHILAQQHGGTQERIAGRAPRTWPGGRAGTAYELRAASGRDGRRLAAARAPRRPSWRRRDELTGHPRSGCRPAVDHRARTDGAAVACRSTSRGSPHPSARRAPPVRPRSATS